MKFGLIDYFRKRALATQIKEGFFAEQFVLSDDAVDSATYDEDELIPGSRLISPWLGDIDWKSRDEARQHKLASLSEAVEELVERSTVLHYKLDQWLQHGLPSTRYIFGSDEDTEVGDRPVELPPDADLTPDIEFTMRRVKKRWSIPLSSDVIVRSFRLATPGQPRAFIVYVDGLTSGSTISATILEPLMIMSPMREEALKRLHAQDAFDLRKHVLDQLMTNHQVEIEYNLDKLLQGVVTGKTALFIDGCPWGLALESKGYDYRGISEPKTEEVVRGPRESFTENNRVNTSLVRRRLRTPDLVIEGLQVGTLSRTEISLLYLKNVANPRLVDEVRKRIESIDVDYMAESSMLEHVIEDSPTGIWPTTLATERPDRVAAYLSEGHVALLANDNPFAIIMPATYTSWFHTAEDYYLRWPYGTILRLLRIFGILVNLYLPAFYLAVATYHQEMMPTPLLLAIAASRETVPFPLFLEILILELSFDLLREAGIRVPSAIGPTLGIVGALILGQAAVAASLISPFVVIIVSITALGSFAIPNYSFALTARMLHYLMLFAAAFLGIYGMAIITFLLMVDICRTRSFGVPLTSPVAPEKPVSADLVLASPITDQERRPSFLRPLDMVRQATILRPWAPEMRAMRKAMREQRKAEQRREQAENQPGESEQGVDQSPRGHDGVHGDGEQSSGQGGGNPSRNGRGEGTTSRGGAGGQSALTAAKHSGKNGIASDFVQDAWSQTAGNDGGMTQRNNDGGGRKDR